MSSCSPVLSLLSGQSVPFSLSPPCVSASISGLISGEDDKYRIDIDNTLGTVIFSISPEGVVEVIELLEIAVTPGINSILITTGTPQQTIGFFF